MLDKEIANLQGPGLFKPGKNCWHSNSLRHGALLIDCANFYRAIHDSISKAQRSIFIIGWEVDSTIMLLRGEDEKRTDLPSNILDLLAWKAKQNPELRIYILRWDSSVAFIADRELLPEHVWTMNTPENINFCLDDTIPLGGSHHQKLILIDDEVIFSGGMDIARQRWDERDHRPHEPDRTDAAGPYGPYHDVQIVMDGPIVENFSELVRWRWKNAAGYDALPMHSLDRPAPRHLATAWPEDFPPVFKDLGCAIARTIPSIDDAFQVEEVRQMYLDLISLAEDFIYIENQYLTCKNIARALNQRLQEERNLRLLIVSSHNPQGLFESEGMWAGRIEFRKIVEEGVDLSRVKFCSSGLKKEGEETIFKRIHSKIFVVDDKYMNVGSANINNRSMTLDTECDVIIAASTKAQAQSILQMRNDLIAEHTGRTVEEVAEVFAQNATLDQLMNTMAKDRYTLHELRDSEFTEGNFYSLASGFSDPNEPFLAYNEAKPKGRIVRALRNPNRMGILALVAFALVIGGVSFFVRSHMSWFTTENVKYFLETVRSSPWAFPIVIMIYVVGGFILFPVTVLSLITAAVFGSLWGPVYGMCGALASASVMFGIGHWLGLKGVRGLLGDRVRKIDAHFKEVGIIGIAILRFLPIAPFSIVNVAAGISSVRFHDFMIGSFLGFLPAFIAKGIVGDSLAQVFLNPTAKTTAYLGVGIVLWILLVTGSYFLAKYWQKRQQS